MHAPYTDEQRLAVITLRAKQLIAEAARLGVIVTIEQLPLQPLAMGNYFTSSTVRLIKKATQ